MLRGPFQHLNIDLGRNEVTAPWIIGAVHLTPREAEVILILRDASGPMQIGRVIGRMYGIDEPTNARKMLHVYIMRLRRKLAHVGLRIVTYAALPGEDAKYELVWDRDTYVTRMAEIIRTAAHV